MAVGRKNNSGSARQRSRLEANQEVRRAANAPRPKPFGIRRPLSYESQLPILGAFRELIDSDEIPETVRARRRIHVTEMPLRKLDAQLSRGIVIGYNFGRRSARVEHDIKEDAPKRIEARLGEVAVFKNRFFGLHVESEELEEEYRNIRVTMGELGLKGAMRDVEPLHATVGEVASGRDLSRFEKRHTVRIMNEVLPVGEMVTLDPIEFYPADAIPRG